MASKDPRVVTIRGRLSFPEWTHDYAVKRNADSPFPKADPNEVSCSAVVVVDQQMLDKLLTHLESEYFPSIKALAPGEKGHMDPKVLAKLETQLAEADWEDQPPYIAIKPVSEKTIDYWPEAVAQVKVTGPKGEDLTQMAIVQSEDDLAVPDPNRIVYPAVLPIDKTIYKMYAGCNVVVTLNLYSFVSGKQPGWSAGVSCVIFHSDNDRFGGGVSIDMDEVFMD